MRYKAPRPRVVTSRGKRDGDTTANVEEISQRLPGGCLAAGLPQVARHRGEPMSFVDELGPSFTAAAGFAPVYLVEKDRRQREEVAAILRACGLTVSAFVAAGPFLDRLAVLAPGCIVIGSGLGADGMMALLGELPVRGCFFPVVAMTPSDDVPAAVRAMKAGATDVVVRPIRPEELSVAVLGALATLARARHRQSNAGALRVRLALLTRRERQVMEGMVRGEVNKSIANQLGISPRTVEVHRARVMEKLACRSLPEIVRFALQAGLHVG